MPPKDPPIRFIRRRYAVAVVVGIVVGAGIFRTPPLIAAVVPSETAFLALWIAGALLSLVGALCYAELASVLPQAGGEYAFLRRAFGLRFAVLYGWARLLIIQSGSIALLAYVYGDYATTILSLGQYSAAVHAALAVIAITAVQWAGIRFGGRAQLLLTLLELAGLAVLVVAGLSYEPVLAPASPVDRQTSIGLALVFVMLTFGGWNEAAYLASEIEQPSRRFVQVLLVSLAIITGFYLSVNFAFLRVLGLDGLARSEAPAADLLAASWGAEASVGISLMVMFAALASAHGTVLTGARSAYALGRDVGPLRFVGRWQGSRSTPANALLVQGLVALCLVTAGVWARDGFQLAVEYTAPAFWFYFLAVGFALFALRRSIPSREKRFEVPLYPLTPVVFCLTSAYLLYSSVAYSGVGGLVSVIVLSSGVLLFPFLSEETGRKDE